jgi:hypothetical protein
VPPRLELLIASGLIWILPGCWRQYAGGWVGWVGSSCSAVRLHPWEMTGSTRNNRLGSRGTSSSGNMSGPCLVDKPTGRRLSAPQGHPPAPAPPARKPRGLQCLQRGSWGLRRGGAPPTPHPGGGGRGRCRTRTRGHQGGSARLYAVRSTTSHQHQKLATTRSTGTAGTGYCWLLLLLFVGYTLALGPG